MRCVGCDTEFVQSGGRGRPKKYCSYACRMKYKTTERIPRQIHQVVCRHCDSPFESVAWNARYCADCRRPGKKGGLRLGLYDRQPIIITKECIGCGQGYTTKHYDQLYCSRDCGWKHQTYANRLPKEVHVHRQWVRHIRRWLCSLRPKRTKEEIRWAALQRRYLGKSSDVVLRDCVECERQFYSAVWQHKKHCCELCAVRARRRRSKQTRRARKRSAFVETVDSNVVFERAGWCCQWCGIATPKSNRGSICDNAPEVDHIIPLSQGGIHSYANVQLLCRSCNGIKSDWTELEMVG